MTTCSCDPDHAEIGGRDRTCDLHRPPCPHCGPGYRIGDDGCHHRAPTAVDLTTTEIETLTEPLYDGYRLGVYQSQDYLPMWHELATKPTGTPEAVSLLERVRAIVVNRTARAETERDLLHARIHRLAKHGCGATSAELWNIIREPRR